MSRSSKFLFLLRYIRVKQLYLFTPPIACSTITRIEEMSLFSAFSSSVSSVPLVRFLGEIMLGWSFSIPVKPVSVHAVISGGIDLARFSLSASLLSCLLPDLVLVRITIFLSGVTPTIFFSRMSFLFPGIEFVLFLFVSFCFWVFGLAFLFHL